MLALLCAGQRAATIRAIGEPGLLWSPLPLRWTADLETAAREAPHARPAERLVSTPARPDQSHDRAPGRAPGAVSGRPEARFPIGSSPETGVLLRGLDPLALQRVVGNRATCAVLANSPIFSGRRRRLQRTPAPSGGVETTNFTRPRVSIALSILQRARELACNEPADLAAARTLIAGLEEWMDEVANISRREKAFRSLGFAKQVAMQSTGHSIDAVTSLHRKIALWQGDSDGPAPPMHRSQWDYHISEFEIGMEFLEVLTGERTLDQTSAPALEEGAWTTIDVLVSTMPVVGTLLVAGEAIVGRDLAGRKLSGLHRALLGGLVILSELGTLIRAASAATDALRIAALSKAEVSVLRNVSRARAVALVAGARSLTAPEKSLLKRLARLVKTGGKLSPEDLVKANALLGKMNEAGMAAEALERNAAKLQGATGLVVEEGAQISESTKQVGEKLLKARRFKQALALKEQPGALQGVKTADFVMDGQLVEAYVPKSTRVDNVIKEIADYHRQAGTFAVDLSKSTIRSFDLITQLGRLWGKPQATDIGLVIVIDGELVTDVARPSVFRLTDVAAVAGPAATSASKAGQQSGSN
jgi:hypothetical protein